LWLWTGGAYRWSFGPLGPARHEHRLAQARTDRARPGMTMLTGVPCRTSCLVLSPSTSPRKARELHRARAAVPNRALDGGRRLPAFAPTAAAAPTGHCLHLPMLSCSFAAACSLVVASPALPHLRSAAASYSPPPPATSLEPQSSWPPPALRRQVRWRNPWPLHSAA